MPSDATRGSALRVAANVLLKVLAVLVSQVMPFLVVVMLRWLWGMAGTFLSELAAYVDGNELITMSTALVLESLTFVLVDCGGTMTKADAVGGLMVPLLMSFIVILVGAASITGEGTPLPLWVKCALLLALLGCIVGIELCRQGLSETAGDGMDRDE